MLGKYRECVIGAKMANLSQQRREKMLEVISQLRDERQDDVQIVRALNEIEKTLNEKKYGLVWEEHTEHVDEMLEANIPVLDEVKERKITVDESLDYNFLIEGDNLHALKLLEKTHRGKVDVIYIDPPYNTGNDFIYDDSYVDSSDSFTHSKWLSFMSKRLKKARQLLSSKGIIFISIDDREHAALKCLCDEIFGSDNFIGNFVWVRKKKGSFLNKKIRKMTEYILCYSKQNNSMEFFGESAYKDKWQPIVKRTNSIKTLKVESGCATTKLDNGYYKSGQYVEGNTGVKFLNDFYVEDGVVITELNLKGRFVWTQEFLDDELRNGTKIELSKKFGFNVLRYNQGEKTKAPSSLINSENGVGTNEDASKELESLLEIPLEDSFSYSKPKSLIQYLINMTKIIGNDLVVLDFFAGSGTTGHAVAALNKEDGGNRRYILCTNNENGIAENVTYKRLTAIQDELPHNLKYFKTEYVPKFNEDTYVSSTLLEHIKPLIELEYACDLESSRFDIILDEDEFDGFIEDGKVKENGILFIASDILMSSDQEQILKDKNCRVEKIPEYYYKEELIESGEI